MAVTRHTYATREQLRAAGSAWNAQTDDDLADRLVETHSAKVDELFHRRFYPLVATRRYDWPSRGQASSSILWLDDDLLEVLQFTASGSAVTDYVLGPETLDAGPFDRIELEAGASFGTGGLRALEVEAVWGYTRDEVAVGTLSDGINDTATSLTLTAGGVVGVGDLLHIGDERILVTDRPHVVSDDLEDGSASRTYTVRRGMYGTTAASHEQGAAVARHVPPGLIRDLVIAESIAQRIQEEGGYLASVGPGGQAAPERIALLDLRKRAREAYERVERIAL